MFHKTKLINGNKAIKFLKKKLRLISKVNEEHKYGPHSFNKFLNVYTNF